jgi:hypothetical protein
MGMVAGVQRCWRAEMLACRQACVSELSPQCIVMLWLYTILEAHGDEQSIHLALPHRAVGALRVSFLSGWRGGMPSNEAESVPAVVRAGRSAGLRHTLAPCACGAFGQLKYMGNCKHTRAFVRPTCDQTTVSETLQRARYSTPSQIIRPVQHVGCHGWSPQIASSCPSHKVSIGMVSFKSPVLSPIALTMHTQAYAVVAEGGNVRLAPNPANVSLPLT